MKPPKRWFDESMHGVASLLRVAASDLGYHHVLIRPAKAGGEHMGQGVVSCGDQIIVCECGCRLSQQVKQ